MLKMHKLNYEHMCTSCRGQYKSNQVQGHTEGHTSFVKKNILNIKLKILNTKLNIK